jgi:quinoprotein glucose dehydrogenase
MTTVTMNRSRSRQRAGALSSVTFAAILGLVLLQACDRESATRPADAVGPSLPSAIADAVVAGEWLSINGDLAGSRYSRLREIHTGNVADLALAWSHELGAADDPERGPGFTAIVAGGLLFAIAADRVLALDPDTGGEVWRYFLGRGMAKPRALAWWRGQAQAEPRLFFTTGDTLIALNARNGRLATAFGNRGVVALPDTARDVPVIFGSLVLISLAGNPARLLALDALHGEMRWESELTAGTSSSAVPRAGAEDRGSAAHSVRVSVDIDRALIYAVPPTRASLIASAASPSDEPAASSRLVALRANDGAVLWQFEAVVQDVWGYGLRAAPALLDAGAASSPSLVLTTAGGYAYFLDRLTGEPRFPVVHLPVPAGGEANGPTALSQPVPTRTPPLARVSFSADDRVTAADTLERHADVCAWWSEALGELRNDGPFTHYADAGDDTGPSGRLLFPGIPGAVGWGGVAIDPEPGYVFVNTRSVGTLAGIPGLSDTAQGWPPPFAVRGIADDPDLLWPCQRHPWGELVAVNAATGGIAWRVPLGVTDGQDGEHSRTGRPNLGGAIVTAGGLVFIGATDDGRLRAFASRTGDELWSSAVGMNAHSVPATFLGGNGRQYVAFAVTASASGRQADTARLLVYALP